MGLEGLRSDPFTFASNLAGLKLHLSARSRGAMGQMGDEQSRLAVAARQMLLEVN